MREKELLECSHGSLTGCLSLNYISSDIVKAKIMKVTDIFHFPSLAEDPQGKGRSLCKNKKPTGAK